MDESDVRVDAPAGADAQVIGIAATFTAEPIQESLGFWMQELGTPARVDFAPFNQLFQQLLDPSSLLSRNDRGVNVLLVRLEDWLHVEGADGWSSAVDADGRLAQQARELVSAVAGLTRRTTTPCLVCLCPPSSGVASDSRRRAVVQQLEERIAAGLDEIPGVHVVATAELTDRYPEAAYYDAHADAQGSVPYTPRFFAALGTLLARRISALRNPPLKVILLDGDDTLWKGICGEDGWSGVEVDAPRRALQEFMLRQIDAGMLLGVCSKNNEADVIEVFDRHPAMVLRREHIAAWRVNWRRKSENIKALAAELGLGTDSFVLVDDSALERAEVEAHCPEVLTVQLPDDPELIPTFLENFWAFDHPKVTGEDKRRTELYRQNAQREELRGASTSLRSFLESLDLRVEISAMQPRQVGRVAQLTQRTNQFNVHPAPRSESEVQALLHAEGSQCLVVDARDRFGAYGLVGALIVAVSPEVLRVDTFLLSCRALGRGVEHRMLAALGQLAVERGIPTVEVPFRQTERNRPARDFLDRLARPFRGGEGERLVYRLPAEFAAAATVEAWLDAPEAVAGRAEAPASPGRLARALDRDWVARLHHAAATLYDDERVFAAIEARRQRQRPDAAPPAAPRTPVEERLARIWTQVLGIDRVGVEDSFFDLGGHSILAMELISRVGDAFQVELPLRSVFETPTVAGLAEAITAHLPQPGGSGDVAVGLPAITPAPEQQHLPFPLTDIQQAYWVGRTGTYELGNVAAHFYTEVDFTDLDLERFGRAWQRLIERHGMLRAIVRPDGQQQILEQVPAYTIELLDLRGRDPAAAEACLAELREQLSHQVRPPDRWPLFEIRASLLDDGRVRVHYSFDMLIVDIFSLLLLSREAAALYRDPEAALEPLTLSFRDYVLGEAAFRDSEPYRRSAEYWRLRLAELPPAPELPLATAPAAITQPRFVRRSVRLDPRRWERLKTRATRAGVTPTGAVLAAYAEILAAWSKSPRFSLNLTLFNRLPLHEQVNAVVGDSTLVELLAVDATPVEAFEARAARIQQQLWADLDHRYVGGIRVIRELARGQEVGTRATMPVVFTSALGLTGEGADSLPFAAGGEPAFGITQTPQVWLACDVLEHAGALVVNWDAVEALFPEGMLPDMFGAFGDLLGRLADDEATWQATTRDALPPHQRRQRQAVNATGGPVPAGLLHEPFLAQVGRRRGQPAVVTRDRALSYEEVYRRSLRLARDLRQRGARPNHLVAVVMEKGWEQVVATLAVLQAGAAYLPIDPELPRERVRYLLEHGEVALVLTQPWVDDRLDWPERVQRLRVDGAEPAGEAQEPLEALPTPADLAYVIFTSGSTGQPKGVMIDHRGALNTILDLNQRFQVGPGERVFALSSLSFDLSVYDIFGTLAAGGTIVLPDASATRDPAQWSELLLRERVTLWNSVPALMQMLVEYAAGHPGAFPQSLRLAWLSGDWIPVSLPEQIRALRPGVQVISMGGATEASIWSILYPIDEVGAEWKSIPYGRPMRNQTFHVLDHLLEPRPIWVPGQLYIGGIGLAKGYWRDEVKTRAKFIRHPRTGERLYHTGDLGRYLPTGEIEFLGREDFQVKIQGFRIELGEIEAALAQHPAVRECVVAARAGGSSAADKRLVAYAVPADGRSLDEAELRGFLREKLPGYMVPADLVPLAALPLTPNGKVDRGALPAPDHARPELRQSSTAPRDALEAELVEIWQQALGVEPIGVTDNFFELGGHSLLAVTLFAQIEATYGRKLPLATLFRGPTIAQLASMLRAEEWRPEWSPLVAIQPHGSRPPLFLMHSSGGNVLEYEPLARHLGADQPVYALQARGLDGSRAASDRVEEMASEYLAAVRAVQPEGPYRLGGFCLGGMLAFEMAQRLRAQGEEVALLAMIENPAHDYLTPLPGTAPLQLAVDRAMKRLDLELSNLAVLERRAQATEVLKRTRRLMTIGQVQVEKAAEPLLAKIFPSYERSRAYTLESVTRAHDTAYHAYVPRPYRGPAVLLRASKQPPKIQHDPSLGWSGLAQGGLEIYEVQGYHKNILKEPRVRTLAERLRACLDAAEPRASGIA